jgi:pimeloyl-ACP methyl ester carboxylesterase
MPYAESQGARIYYEETGRGTPILFIHEFGGDYRSWREQMRHFGRGWRAIAWSARGYPRSDAPADETLYGQDFFNRDAVAVLDAAGVAKAHIVGLSMGGYTALMLAAKYPERVISCVAAGAGSGALKATRTQFIEESLAEHPAHAAARTLRTVQAGRASLYDVEAELKAVAAPVLLLVGDEDEPCLDVNLWMKRLMPTARLGLLPGAGHAINLEEPELFNQLVAQFIAEVERSSWRPRDPRAR